MTRKNETQHWIKAKGREKFENTKPERVVEILLNGLNYLAEKGLEIEVRDEDGKYWTMKPDFRLLKPNRFLAGGYDNTKNLVEVDGIYHETKRQEQKTRWRDALLAKAGWRVIHVSARLTENTTNQAYLKSELTRALESPWNEPIVRIDA